MNICALIDFAVAESKAVLPRREWTVYEEQILERSLPVMTKAEIGQALGRSENAIKIRQVRARIPAPSRRPGYLTANQVSHYLGMDIHSVTRMEELGILHFQVLPGPRRIRSIKLITLKVWMINPENWIYFKPERVRDPRMRRLIELRRQKWNDAWWSTGEVCRHYGLIESNTVTQAIYRGQLKAKRWGNWRIKRSDALARPFYARKGSSTGKSHWSPRADAWILRARDELGMQFIDIAPRMGWNVKKVMYRYKLLKQAETSFRAQTVSTETIREI